jgi:hypothetical protein
LPFTDPVVGIMRVGFVGHQLNLSHCPFANIHPDIRPRATVKFSAVSPTASPAPLHLPLRMDIGARLQMATVDTALVAQGLMPGAEDTTAGGFRIKESAVSLISKQLRQGGLAL